MKAWQLGATAFLASHLLFAFGGEGVAVLLAAFVLAGVENGFAEAAQHPAVAATANVELRGSAFGLLADVQAFGNLAANIVAGLLWTFVSPEAAFLCLGAWMLLSLVTLLRVQ